MFGKILSKKESAAIGREGQCFLKSSLFCGFRLALILVPIFTVQSCITSQRMMDNINGHYYKYTFAVREATTHKKTTQFEHNNFMLHFDPAYNRVNFDLTNTGADPIEILWDQTSLVVAADSSQVIHGGVALSSSRSATAPTIVASHQTLKDFILPLELIQTVDGHQTISDIYPEKDDSLSVKNDWIMRLIGQDLFTIHLALRIKGKAYNFPFHFYPIVMQRGAKSFKPVYSNK